MGGEIDWGWIGEWIKRGGEEEGVLGNLFGWVWRIKRKKNRGLGFGVKSLCLL